MSRLCVLTIAGSDSGGGAGVQADARTIHALGAHALTAIAAVTAQNTRGVLAWRAVTPRLIAQQMEAVLADFAVGAVKTGLLPGAAAVRVVARALARVPGIPLVVDPVLGSTSGTRFFASAGMRALVEELLPRATVVTPNWPEAEALSGIAVTSFEAAEEAAWRILEKGCAGVLVKGGHAPGRRCRDVLVTRGGPSVWFEHARVTTRNTHGTGCVLSAAIATELGRGREVADAVRRARAFLEKALRAGKRVELGAGRGPALVG